MRSIRTDSACIARHRSSARLVILRVLHAGVRLELEGRDDRTGMDLDDRALRRRTRGTSPRAAARRPSARARRSCARSSARRAARAAAACTRPCGVRPAPWSPAPDRTAAGAEPARVTFGGFGGRERLGGAERRSRTRPIRRSPLRLRPLVASSAAPARLARPAAAAPFFVCLAMTSRRCCLAPALLAPLAERAERRARSRRRSPRRSRRRSGRTRTASTG